MTTFDTQSVKILSQFRPGPHLNDLSSLHDLKAKVKTQSKTPSSLNRVGTLNKFKKLSVAGDLLGSASGAMPLVYEPSGFFSQ